MHDDDGLIPKDSSKVILRHFDRPVGIRELLHSTLDRLFNELMIHKEPAGAVAVMCLDADGPMSGKTIVLALDLDPEASEYEP